LQSGMPQTDHLRCSSSALILSPLYHDLNKQVEILFLSSQRPLP
jgi:hypothetical protein